MNDRNASYVRVGVHNGYPRFKSASGFNLYYNVELGLWMVHTAFTPHKTVCNANIEAADELLPIGCKTWNVEQRLLGTGSGWDQCDLTMKPLEETADAVQEVRAKRELLTAQYESCVSSISFRMHTYTRMYMTVLID